MPHSSWGLERSWMSPLHSVLPLLLKPRWQRWPCRWQHCSKGWCAGGGRWCPTHCYPMDWSCTGFSVHGISQARILEWIAISSSRGSSWPRDLIRVSCVFCMAGRFFTHWAMGDSQRMIEQQFRRNLVPGWLWKAEMPHNTGPLISNLFHKMKSSEPL